MKAIRINPRDVWSDENLPFNQAVVEPEGRRVNVTGQVAWNAEGKVVGESDAEQQAECALGNIKKILGELGGELSDIVALTMYYVKDTDVLAIRKVRKRHFQKTTSPAVTAIRVAGLVDPSFLVEFTATAVIPLDRFRAPR